MSEDLKVDVNVTLPEELQAEAKLRAIQINPANMTPPPAPGTPPSAVRLAVLRAKLWPKGHTLSIRFDWNKSKFSEDRSKQKRIEQKVIDYASQWTEHANLHFAFGDNPNATIRITFDPSLGSWSYIGTDNLLIAPNQATMNLGWLTPDSPDEEYSQVVLHEFGHAIGCIHEHSTTIARIKWNKPVAYAYYARLGWDKAKTDYNVFAIFDEPSTNHSSFDAESIMTYPIPKEHTLDGFEIPWRSRLSPMDKEYIAKVYAKA